MSFFSRFFKKPVTENNQDIGATGLTGYNGQVDPGYRFNTVGFRQPGIGYHSPLLQYQEYPRNLVQGNGGVLVQRFFQPFEPQWLNQPLQPVSGGTSGTITGQTAFQPLVDTSGNTSVG
jgi:hypothetical protein